MNSHHVLHANITHLTKEKPIRSKKFSQQNVEFDETPLFFPEGYENFFLVVYFITLPYIAGFLFLFLYISKASIDIFSSVYQHSSFILTWAIGYEIIAGLALLWIAKMAIHFGKEDLLSNPKQFRMP